MNIRVIENTAPKTMLNESELGFGKHFTDHMFVMDYEPIVSHTRIRPSLAWMASTSSALLIFSKSDAVQSKNRFIFYSPLYIHIIF